MKTKNNSQTTTETGSNKKPRKSWNNSRVATLAAALLLALNSCTSPNISPSQKKNVDSWYSQVWKLDITRSIWNTYTLVWDLWNILDWTKWTIVGEPEAVMNGSIPVPVKSYSISTGKDWFSSIEVVLDATWIPEELRNVEITWSAKFPNEKNPIRFNVSGSK